MTASALAICVALLLLEPSLGSVSIGGLELPTFPILPSPPSFEVWVDGEASPQNAPVNISFPLQRTEVSALITSGVVRAKVTQVYRNDGNECLQSRYIFPLPTRSAISAMSMRIGTRTILGEIRTRSQARKEFLQAQQAGQSASLLDQERPNVFAMELANIQPGETTEVVMEYSQTLSPIDGVYAFTFPAVVGPRYGKGWEPGQNTSDLSTLVDFTAQPSCLGIDSSLALQNIRNSSNITQVQVVGRNADIVIKFWFTERNVGAQFLLATWGLENYFSLAIQPPQRQLLQPDQISPREYLFILDVSGSMTGYPIDLSKQLMTKLLKENVRSGDSLNILLFAGGSQVLSADRNVEATPNNIDNALSWLDQNMHAGGGTQLLPALRTAFDLPGFTANVAKTIIIMTDGYVTVEKEAFDLVRNNLGVGNVFVFGVGSSVNRYLIEGLARVGYGEPFVVMNEAEGSAAVEQLQRYIDTPVLTQLKLAFTGSFIAKDQEPPHLPDLFASRPIQVVGKWEGQLSGNFTVQGRLPDGSLWEYYGSLASMQVVDLPSVPLLWARSRIAVLGDYETVGVQAENEITALGLNYSLMTQYTSFVSVDSNPEVPGMCGVTASYNTTTTNRAGGMMQTDELSGSRAFSAGMGSPTDGCFRAAPLAILIMSFIAVV